MQNQNWATTAPDQQNAQRTFLTRPPPPQPNQPQAPLVQPQQVQQPPPEQPRYPNVPTTDAYKPFSKDAVETLAHAKGIDQGWLKGTGTFGDTVLADHKAVSEALSSKDKRPNVREHCAKLVGHCEQWMKSNPDAATHNAAKFEECQNLKKAAETLVVRMDVEELAQLKIMTVQSHDDKLRMRQLDANLLEATRNYTSPTHGSSTVGLLKDETGGVAYVFKSVNGESDQTGMAKGSGAIREVMASHICDRIKEKGGPDFGWPPTTFSEMRGVSAERDDRNDVTGHAPIEKGVLIQGVKGDGSITLNNVPPEEIQKVLVCNFILGQFDIKPDNAIFTRDAGGEVRAVPIDGGAAFPDRDSLMCSTQMWGKQSAAIPGATLGVGSELVNDHTKDSIIPQDFKEKVRAIDPKEVFAAGMEVINKAKEQGIHKDVSDRATQGLTNALNSLKIAQKALDANNPNQTLGQFVDSFNQGLTNHLSFVDPLGKQQWDQVQQGKYDRMALETPQLLLPRNELAKDSVVPEKLFANATCEPNFKAHEEIKQLAKATNGGMDALMSLHKPGDAIRMHQQPHAVANDMRSAVLAHKDDPQFQKAAVVANNQIQAHNAAHAPTQGPKR